MHLHWSILRVLLLICGIAAFQPTLIAPRRSIVETERSAQLFHLHRCSQCNWAKVKKLNYCSANNCTANNYKSSKLNLQATRKVSVDQLSRRKLFISTLINASLLIPFRPAHALPFFQQDRRQLELCLVQVLRTKYWAMNVAKSLDTKLLSPQPTNTNSTAVIELSDTQRKQPYLEARLGAKAILTKKIGGGANSNVVKLAGLQLKECLEDARYWCTDLAKTNQLPGQNTGQFKNGKRFCNNELQSAEDELIEALASLVEFDGLETTIDPSPRSSLMIKMYDNQKGKFVYRTLTERIIPSCDRYLNAFGTERLTLCQEYVRREYPEEIPVEILQRLYDSLPTTG